MSKYKNKYKGESLRRKYWNYAWRARYFVTAVTKDRVHFFGEIINGKMILSDIGKIVKNELIKTPDIRPDMNLKLDVFAVMPNHFHCIVEIGKNEFNKFDNNSTILANDPLANNDELWWISASKNPEKYENHFEPQSKNLAAIMRGMKGSITIQAKRINPDFKWQKKFHDHIIRNDSEYQRIKNYIINNPKNWKGN